MKVKIEKEKHNPFLKRKELLVHIDHEGEATPSMEVLEQFLIRETKADPEKIEVLNIYSAKGAAVAKSQVHIWEEKKVVKKKKKHKEEPKKAETKPAEKKKEEKPAEKKKEEAKEAKPEEKKEDEIKSQETAKEEKK